MPITPLLDDDWVVRRVRVAERDVVYVKGIFEASEGLAVVLAEPKKTAGSDGGALVIAAPRSRAGELDELLGDLRRELLGATWE